MIKIPLTICFFTSTKGHFGYKSIYLDTLTHLNMHLPLTSFEGLLAHIKISPGEEELGNKMEQDLKECGFRVLKTVEAWQHGVVHQGTYLRDQIRVSKEQYLHATPYMMLLEDDSPFESHETFLDGCLYRMIRMLKVDRNLLSVRFLRRGDLSSSPMLSNPDDDSKDYFYSPHFNFQPLIMRTADYFHATKIIEDRFDRLSGIQSEMLWRMILAPFSRSEFKHIVWYPDYAETYHLGCLDYETIKKEIL